MASCSAHFTCCVMVPGSRRRTASSMRSMSAVSPSDISIEYTDARHESAKRTKTNTTETQRHRDTETQRHRDTEATRTVPVQRFVNARDRFGGRPAEQADGAAGLGRMREPDAR